MTDVGEGCSNRICGHDVSIPIGIGSDVGRYIGSQPRSKTSMTIVRPPRRGARTRQYARLIPGSGLLLFILNDGRGSTKQLACASDVGGTIAAGEQAVMANAVSAASIGCSIIALCMDRRGQRCARRDT